MMNENMVRAIIKNIALLFMLVMGFYYLITLTFTVEYGHYVWAPRPHEAIAINLILGLSTGATCTTLCGLILIPYVAQRFFGLKEAFKASLIFSLFRLIVYIALATVAFYIGSMMLETLMEAYMKLVVVVLNTIIVLYGLQLTYNWPQIFIRHEKTFCKLGGQHGFSALLGITSGMSTLCPTLWMAIIYTALMKTIFMSIIVIVSFWLGTTFWVLLFGTLSSKLRRIVRTHKGLKNFRKACGMVLLSIGVVYIILTVTVSQT